jgi:hypothetical protein
MLGWQWNLLNTMSVCCSNNVADKSGVKSNQQLAQLADSQGMTPVSERLTLLIWGALH